MADFGAEKAKNDGLVVKNDDFSCVYEKKVVPLHREIENILRRFAVLFAAYLRRLAAVFTAKLKYRTRKDEEKLSLAERPVPAV